MFGDRCPTCGRRKTRSTPQNSRYWALLALIAEKVKPKGQQYSSEIWHHFFKDKFLPKMEVTLPSGKQILIKQSTSDLSVDEFSDYFDQVEALAGEHGVWLDS